MKTHAKGPKARADRFFSLIIRARGRCEKCGRTENLQCAHIFSRRYSTTRCDEANAWCLCAGCHMTLTGDPLAHVEFAFATIGEPAYRELRARALAGAHTKVDWAEVAATLAARWKELDR